MSNKKVRSRVASFLAVVMLLSMLGMFSLPAMAAPTFTNESLQDVVDDIVGGVPANQIVILPLAGRNDLFGDINVQELVDAFPNLAVLDISSTNVTSVTNVGAVNLINVDNFETGERNFVLTATPSLTYAESQGDLLISDLLAMVRIETASGTLNPIPAGMFREDGTVEIGTVPPVITLTNVDPMGAIPQNQMIGMATGPNDVELEFAMAFSSVVLNTAGMLNGPIQLDISLGEYKLVHEGPTPQVVDGGYVYFILTRYCEDGNRIPLEDIAEYDVRLGVLYGIITGLTLEMAPGNQHLRIRIEADAVDLANPGVSGPHSVWLDIYRADTDPLARLARASVFKVYLQAISDLYLQEEFFNTVNSTWFPVTAGPISASTAEVHDGDTIFIRGGTSIATSEWDRRLGNNQTRFLLRGTIGGVFGTQYIPAEYYFHVRQDIMIQLAGQPYVDFELTVVPVSARHPHGALALTFIAQTNDNTGVVQDALRVEATNSVGPPDYAYLELNIQIIPSQAEGYRIYQIPSWLAATFGSRAELEDAIYDEMDGIALIAHYKITWPGGALTLFEVNDVIIVEDSNTFIVAVAYFEDGGRPFLLSDGVMSGTGWYHQDDDPSNMFNDSGWTVLTGLEGDTSIDGWINNSMGFSAGTSVLELRTGEMGYDFGGDPVDPETDGVLVFARMGAAGYFPIPVVKIGAEPDRVLFVPQGYVGLALPWLTTPGSVVYNLNSPTGQFTITMGEDYEFEIVTVFTNGTETRSTAPSPAAPIVNSVSLGNESHAGMLAIVELDENDGGNGDYGVFDVLVGTDGGANDLLAGETIEMTYSSGGLSRTATLVLAPSQISHLHLVYIDHMGNYFSASPAIFENFDGAILELEENFEIPYGTIAYVYALFGFTNEDFFAGANRDWRDYIVSSERLMDGYLSFNATANPGPQIILPDFWVPTVPNPLPDDRFQQIVGNMIGDDVELTATWATTATVTINGADFEILAGTESETEWINVVQPLLRAITVYDAGTPVANAGLITGGVVGDTLNLLPQVTRTGNSFNPGGVPTLALLETVVASGDFLGGVESVEMEIYPAGYAKPANFDTTLVPPATDFGLGLLQITESPDYVQVSFWYTFTLNGMDHSVKLTDANQPLIWLPYSFYVDINPPRIERILLVAANAEMANGSPVTLTQRGDRSIGGEFFDNLFTLPYHLHSTFEVFPVALNSGAWLADSHLDEALDPANPNPDRFLENLLSGSRNYISLEHIAEYSDYLRFLNPDDFIFAAPQAPWSHQNGGGVVRTPGTSSYISTDFFVVGPIQAISGGTKAALRVEFDTNPSNITLSPTGLESYSALANVVAPMDLFHLAEADNVNVVDIRAVSPASPVTLGLPVLVEIGYFLSSDVYMGGVTHTVTQTVPATFFGDVLPGMAGYDVTNYNALEVVLREFTSLDGQTLHRNNADLSELVNISYSGDDLQIIPMLPGEYVFELSIRYNNAGVRVPFYDPGFVEIRFEVEIATINQSIYYNDVEPLDFAAHWTSAVEVVAAGGTARLDADALNGGFLLMDGNIAGTSIVHLYNGTVRVAEIEVERVQITAQNAVLMFGDHNNPPTLPSTHDTFANRLFAEDGDFFHLYWYVEYETSNTTTIFRERTVDNWDAAVTNNSNVELDLDGRQLTVKATEDALILYTATHSANSAPVQFWAEIDASNTADPFETRITDDEDDIDAEVLSVNLYTIGGTPRSATLFAWDLITEDLAEIVMMTSNNNHVHLAQGSTPESFVITAISAGTSTVRVYLATGGYAQVLVNVTQWVPAPVSVSGTITNPDGQTVSGATVTITGNGFTATTTSAADGTYSFANVPSGIFSITATAAGYGTGVRTVIVISTSLTNQDIQLPTGDTYRVEGHVRDLLPPNPVVPYATVTIFNLATGFMLQTYADTDGFYYFDDIPDGATYRVIAAAPNAPAPGFGTGSHDVTVNGADVSDHDIYLPPPAGTLFFGVSGHVLDDNGDAVVGASVTIVGQTNGVTFTTTSGANGAYSFTGLPNNDVYIVTATYGGEDGSIFVPLSGADATNQNVTLGTPVPLFFSVSGYVLDDGVAVPGASVTINGPGGFTAAYTTNANGYFSFVNNVPAGTNTLTATDGNETGSITILVGSNMTNQNINIGAAPATFDVTGQVLSSVGGGIAGATVTIAGPSGFAATATTVAGGNFTFTNVPDGTHTVTATHASFQTNTATVIVSGANETTTITLLPIAANNTFTVNGVVNSSEGGPIPNAEVVITGPGFTATVQTNASGHYVIPNVPVGTHTVTVTAANFQAINNTGTVTVTSANATVDPITLTPTVGALGPFDVTVQVRNASGNPIPNANVTLTGIGSSITDSAGNFTFTNVPVGTYTATAMATGFQTNTAAVTVTNANVTATITLTPVQGGGPTPGGGGGVVAQNFTVTVEAGSGGTAQADRATAPAGQTVRVTATPNENYEILSVVLNPGQTTLSANAEGVFTFTMPANNVTVNVTFDEYTAVYECDLPFSDIDCESGAWYIDAVKFVYRNGFMQGFPDGTFQPFTALTRAQMVQILWNMEGGGGMDAPYANQSSGFPDVPTNSWMYNAVNWAAENGVVLGFPDGSFRPNELLTREQMVAILYRYADLNDFDTSNAGDLSGFADSNRVGNWALEAMEWAVYAGIVQGVGNNNLAPQDTANRAQVATVVYRFAQMFFEID